MTKPLDRSPLVDPAQEPEKQRLRAVEADYLRLREQLHVALGTEMEWDDDELVGTVLSHKKCADRLDPPPNPSPVVDLLPAFEGTPDISDAAIAARVIALVHEKLATLQGERGLVALFAALGKRARAEGAEQVGLAWLCAAEFARRDSAFEGTPQDQHGEARMDSQCDPKDARTASTVVPGSTIRAASGLIGHVIGTLHCINAAARRVENFLGDANLDVKHEMREMQGLRSDAHRKLVEASDLLQATALTPDVQALIASSIKAIYALRSTARRCWCDNSYDLPGHQLQHQAKCQEATNAVVQLERLSALQEQPTGWQPIETAPKDGTRVLLWAPDDAGVAIIGEHQPGDRDGWWNLDAGAYIDYSPTHWQPLPAPPAVGAVDPHLSARGTDDGSTRDNEP